MFRTASDLHEVLSELRELGELGYLQAIDNT